MALIEGTKGLLQVGPSNSPTTVGKVTQYSIEIKTDIAERGPYIGDPAKRKVRGGRTSSGSMTCEIPVGRDSGQTALINAHENGESIRLHIREGQANEGYVYVAPQAIITDISVEGTAEEGYTLEISWEDDGGYTYGA